MTTQLYQVTLTDLGTYTVTVPGDTPEDACSIAKQILAEEAGDLPTGVKATAREFSATAEVAPTPIKRYQVNATYSVDFSVTVPATNAAEAELNARRYYTSSPFPWEHDVHDDRIRWNYAKECEQ
jgi:hypothetical protein